MFCVPVLIFAGTDRFRSRFHVFADGHVYCGAEGVGSHFHLPRVLGSVFLFCVPILIFIGSEGVGSRFHLLCSRTHFRLCIGRRVPIYCFVLSDSFSTVPTASCLVFIFCAPGFVFRDTRGVGSHFHVLRARTHFRLYGWRPLPFSCFALTNTFSAMRRASGTVLMFFAPGLVFVGFEGVRSRFHVLCPRTRFRWYRGRRVPFSCFASLYLFSAVPRVSGLVFTFCVPLLVFDGSEGVESRFQVLLSWTHFRRYGRRGVPFSYFALPDSFSSVPRASSSVFMFCVPAHRFLWYRRRQVPFSCFALPNMFSHSAEGVGSRFHVLCTRTCFHRFRGCRVPFSCSALPDTFSAVLRSSDRVFMFCASKRVFGDTVGVRSCFHVCVPVLVVGGTEVVGSRFHVVRSWTHFRRYRGRQVPFSCF
jgi:hypothetical protein